MLTRDQITIYIKHSGSNNNLSGLASYSGKKLLPNDLQLFLEDLIQDLFSLNRNLLSTRMRISLNLKTPSSSVQILITFTKQQD